MIFCQSLCKDTIVTLFIAKKNTILIRNFSIQCIEKFLILKIFYCKMLSFSSNGVSH